MFHASFMTILTCFIYTLHQYYAFSGTNLLTRCRSASSSFVLFLVLEIVHRKYSRNWMKRKPRVLFFHGASRTSKESRRRPAGDPHHRGRGPTPGHAAMWCGHPLAPPRPPFRLYILSVAKTLLPRATIRENFQRRRRRQSHLGGFRRSPPAPCRRGESSSGGLYAAMVASGVMCE